MLVWMNDEYRIEKIGLVFVLVQDNTVLGSYKTFEDAYLEAMDRYLK